MRATKAWNGGSRETAMRLARERTEAAIASGCERCPTCAGEGATNPTTICPTCGAAGFLVPEGGMPSAKRHKWTVSGSATNAH